MTAEAGEPQLNMHLVSLTITASIPQDRQMMVHVIKFRMFSYHFLHFGATFEYCLYKCCPNP